MCHRVLCAAAGGAGTAAGGRGYFSLQDGDGSASLPAARFDSCAALNFMLCYDFVSICRHFRCVKVTL